MTAIAKQQKNHFFLYDDELLPEARAEFFDPRHHRMQRTIQGEALGRGTTYFVRLDDHACVLRHYQRGGMAAKLLTDQYFWRGIEQTRAWREWYLLRDMLDKGLPVPRPVAAHVVKSGLYYRADLVTLRLNASKSLTDWLRKKDLPLQQWRSVGRTVRLFHDAGIYHADMNAHNIMLSDDGKVYLIDFDKGQLRPQGHGWQQANIERFQRSLEKLRGQISPFHYSEVVWQHFMRGYDLQANSQDRNTG